MYDETKNRQGDDGSIGPIGSTRMPDAVTHHTCIKSSTEYELGLILKEIRFITDQVSRRTAADLQICAEHSFVLTTVLALELHSEYYSITLHALPSFSTQEKMT